MSDLAGKTIVMSGGSRGIGLAIALRAARDGANVALLAKTAEPHPRLQGTIHTAAEEIEGAGGHALAIVGDVRDDSTVADAVERTFEHFGAIDIVANNASAIDVSPSTTIAMKRCDLMQDVNSLWPRTIIATAAVQNLLGGDAAMARSRRPEIVGDAAHHILTRPARTTTGNLFIDDEVLADAGVTDLGAYAYVPDADLQVDLFLDA